MHCNIHLGPHKLPKNQLLILQRSSHVQRTYLPSASEHKLASCLIQDAQGTQSVREKFSNIPDPRPSITTDPTSLPGKELSPREASNFQKPQQSLTSFTLVLAPAPVRLSAESPLPGAISQPPRGEPKEGSTCSIQAGVVAGARSRESQLPARNVTRRGPIPRQSEQPRARGEGVCRGREGGEGVEGWNKRNSCLYMQVSRGRLSGRSDRVGQGESWSQEDPEGGRSGEGG